MKTNIIEGCPSCSSIGALETNSVTCLRMEVPCCGGMTAVLKEAINRSGENIPLTETVIGVKGDVLGERSY